jgi:hypothetical protein
MRKVLKSIVLVTSVVVTSCGVETEQDTLWDEVDRYANEVVGNCLDPKYKELCSEKLVVLKALDPEEEDYGSICWTENQTGKERRGLAISESLLNKSTNRSKTIYELIFSCLRWGRESKYPLSFAEFTDDLNLSVQ